MNFVKEYVKFASPLTESPPKFHFYMGYQILSMLVNRKAFYDGSGSLPISPNLWMIFIGKSSTTKKSTMLHIARRHIMKEVIADLNQYQSDGSREAFIESIAERPVGIILNGEFAALMSWMGRDYNSGMISMMTDLFDQPDYYRRVVGTRTKKDTFIIQNPFINIATCSTIEWFNEQLSESKINGGFLARFNLIISKENSSCIPITPLPDTALQMDLIKEAGRIASIEFGRMTYSPAARDIYMGWYKSVKNRGDRCGDAGLASFYSRRQTECHKFSMLNCAMRSGELMSGDVNIMNEQDVKVAIEICEEILDNSSIIKDQITLNQYQATRRKMIECIKASTNGLGGAEHSVVMRKMKLSKRDMESHVSSLEEEGTIEVIKAKADGLVGRCKTIYKLMDEYA